jgi:hypothetical protein
MSLESALFDLLKPLVPTNANGTRRVYPTVAPAGVLTPYITFQQVGGEAPVFVDNAVPSKRNARMQINVWSTTQVDANAIALAIEAALVVSTALQARPEGAFVATDDETTKLLGTRQDFSIWADR